MNTLLPKVFTPAKIGSLELRNRTIRAAAFEGMCPDMRPSPELIEYHRSVAAGGIGMTAVAYAAVAKSGLTFSHQLYMRPEIVPELRKLTDAVHKEGAAISIQLGHGGYMSDPKVTGEPALSPSGKFNLYGLVKPKAMNKEDIADMVKAFFDSVKLAQEAGFDAVEIQVGHGYLVSQFLTTLTNVRNDEYGGSLENRARFMREIMRAVREAAGDKTAVLAKMNVSDGFEGGNGVAEAVEIARMLEQEGADALILSGGFVSKTPMYVMRGEIPLKELIAVQPFLNKVGLALFGKLLVKAYPFEPAYFLEDALKVRRAVKTPLVLVGGLNSLDIIEKVLGLDFEFVSMARALIIEPDFVNKLKRGDIKESSCHPCNKCMAFMYNGAFYCPEVSEGASQK